MRSNSLTWMAFLAMAFAVVGLLGLFASYAAPLPLERAMARDSALDEALAIGGPKQALETLRDRLDDSAPAVIDSAGPIADRVAQARTAMHAELRHEADAVGARLRLELVVVTVVAALFGVVVIGVVGRAG